MKVFGPIPSRRLGQSLGVNNIIPKYCPYSCVYCQIGRTNNLTISRREFYKPEDIYNEVKLKIEQAKNEGRDIDYISFVPDGEPTLDINLGREIDMLKEFGVKIAVITNSSLLHMESVRRELYNADWVSVKIDSSEDESFKNIDRPHGHLSRKDILDGIYKFAEEYKGYLVTETMLVKGINASETNIKGIGKIIKDIKPKVSYILVPSRPPAESDIVAPDREFIYRARDIIEENSGVSVGLIIGDEGDGFFVSEDTIEDILSITSVHPIKEEFMNKLLRERNIDKGIINDLVVKGKLREYIYKESRYYVKNVVERGY